MQLYNVQKITALSRLEQMQRYSVCTVYFCILDQMYVNKSRTYEYTIASGPTVTDSDFMWRVRLFFEELSVHLLNRNNFVFQ